MPRTDDDLDGSSGVHPTEQIPTYRGADSTDDARTAGYANVPDQSTRAFSTSEVGPAGAGMAGGTAGAGMATGAVATDDPSVRREVVETKERRGSLDLGLLILRVSVGAIILVHGLQKLTGWFDGPGLSGFEETVAGAGYDQARLLSVFGAIGEVAGGALLILGLATPLAGAAVVAVMINAWLVRQVAEPGLQFFAPDGVEYETLLVLAAAAIVLTGPGRIAIDGGRGWARRPFIGSFLALALGIGGAVAIWILLNGADPFVM